VSSWAESTLLLNLVMLPFAKGAGGEPGMLELLQ